MSPPKKDLEINKEEDYTKLALPWVRNLIDRPDFQQQYYPNRQAPEATRIPGAFRLIRETLWSNDTIPAALSFTLSDPTNTAFPWRMHYLVALGSAMDFTSGYLGGGITCHLLDWGFCQAALKANGASLTVDMQVKFLKPVLTPTVVVVKGSVTGCKGRRCWVEGTLEDGEGNVLASAKGEFAQPPVKGLAEKFRVAANVDYGLGKPKI
jgi:acyl-coenzyme A thioesterase PaaI-like protein